MLTVPPHDVWMSDQAVERRTTDQGNTVLGNADCGGRQGLAQGIFDQARLVRSPDCDQ